MSTNEHPPAGPSPLSDAGRDELLALARAAVVAAVRGRPDPPLPDAAELARPGAAFVTIHAHGRLRGCIGTVEPARDSLASTVLRMAQAAALEDPRFPPLREDELPGVHLEISVMGPLTPVQALDQVVTGRDGLVVEQGSRRGLLLPQVATEWGWDRETFVRETCAKAGLPRDAWQRGARVLRFSAEVFAERGSDA